MTETSLALSQSEPNATNGFWTSANAQERRKARHRADLRLRAYGMFAIGIAVLLLGILLTSLITTGYTAFLRTNIAIPYTIDRQYINEDNLARSNWRKIRETSIRNALPQATEKDYDAVEDLFTRQTYFLIRDRVVADPSLVGKTVTMAFPASDIADQLNKGQINLSLPENRRRISNFQASVFEEMERRGMIETPLNWGLIFNADSRFPELAGLSGAIVGSFYAILVCFLISFPVGVAAATYLEEFAPKNRWTDIIEVNINNLAAVPSIVFGLLGLAVFLNFFGLPRSAPLVGGMVLSLMTLPTIIIVTRAALKAVPPSIREGALGMGASKHQVILHHVLPLALPGMLTGTIIGLAQALGETAPLLLIGMNAFITSPPGGILDASTALPTQIYIWADSPERGFNRSRRRASWSSSPSLSR
ncbi:MAG: phosphate ABC transporter permease PstA [Pseudomonadota bacterium]